MGLSARIRYRLDDWTWRLRYWWMDTESGARAHVGAFVVALLVLVYQVAKMALAALFPPPPGEPAKAVYWWVVQLIIAIVSAVLSYILRPKVPPQAETEQKGPTVEDGLCVDDHFGTVVVRRPHMLAWRIVRREKIQAKGGKK